jgi:hypothetical protein
MSLDNNYPSALKLEPMVVERRGVVYAETIVTTGQHSGPGVKPQASSFKQLERPDKITIL